MPIQQEIILRYRSSGHIRFQIPERLCSPDIATFVSDAIARIEGVYRVHLFKNSRKLSIRYSEGMLNFTQLTAQLLQLFSDLEARAYFTPQPAATTPVAHSQSKRITSKLSQWKGARWAKDKYLETKETAQAISIVTKLGLKKKPAILEHPEKTLITFFNDVLVLYLIKTHWKLITKKWLLTPFKYRYEWLAIFYLMYLFIRSKNLNSK